MKTSEPAKSPLLSTGPDPDAVRRMFGAIAHRYDFLNHFLSASIDKRWRRVTVHKVRELLVSGPNAVCLDLCSGTGDLALEIHRRLNLTVVASDFCHPMLQLSLAKFRSDGSEGRIRTVEADALSLPFPNSAFDAVTIAFGLRNLANTRCGLEEMVRILKPGGVVVILEFSKPVIPLFRQAFGLYFRTILPRLGGAISGQDAAYRYLHDSVQQFPSQLELLDLMVHTGFKEVGYRNLTGGIAAMHWGRAE
jgi:demethylmenaquinone methyltransferase/2-methoxy-6-polyprenyl-1,4-benzoquinol methylase